MNFERENIRRMSGYTSGEQPDDDKTIKLNTNENPYPPSPRVDNVLDSISGKQLRRYPPSTAIKFRQLAAQRHGVAADNVIATRGGDELLRLVITTFVEPGEVIAMTDPTYSLYPVLAQIQNSKTHGIPLEDNWDLPDDFAAQVNRTNAKLTFLVNPHAPTGALLTLDVLDSIAKGISGLLLLDEAYIDFVDPTRSYDSIELVRQNPNIILLRSLSKGYGLAGLRFGYGIAPEELISPMISKTRDSYNLDYISQKIAETAFDDLEYAASTWEKVRLERSRLHKALSVMGLHTPASDANFLLATIPEALGVASDITDELKDRGILVRYFDQPRLSDKIRISIGTPAENDALLEALSSVLN